MPTSRRHFLRTGGALAATPAAIAFGLPSPAQAQTTSESRPQRVAAIQFEPKVGDIGANLARVDAMARDALARGARWVVLPEFFPSGNAMHPALFEAYHPVDGRPAELLKDLAKAGGAYVCGSFLSRSGGDAFNTMVIACPDGTVFTHDKDFPTMVFESAFYAGGEDGAYAARLAQDGARTLSVRVAPRPGSSADGAFTHGGTAIGSALCWELVRHRTARRLVGKVDLLLASSGWWTVDPERDWPGLPPDQARTAWNEHQALILAAPQRMARLLGVPVVHANFTGANPGYASLAFDRQAHGKYLGSSQVVDAQGRTVARLGAEQGILMAEVTLGAPTPAGTVPDEFWMPEVSESMRRRWATSGAAGRDHYLGDTRVKRLR